MRFLDARQRHALLLLRVLLIPVVSVRYRRAPLRHRHRTRAAHAERRLLGRVCGHFCVFVVQCWMGPVEPSRGAGRSIGGLVGSGCLGIRIGIGFLLNGRVAEEEADDEPADPLGTVRGTIFRIILPPAACARIFLLFLFWMEPCVGCVRLFLFLLISQIWPSKPERVARRERVVVTNAVQPRAGGVACCMMRQQRLVRSRMSVASSLFLAITASMHRSINRPSDSRPLDSPRYSKTAPLHPSAP